MPSKSSRLVLRFLSFIVIAVVIFAACVYQFPTWS